MQTKMVSTHLGRERTLVLLAMQKGERQPFAANSAARLAILTDFISC